MTNAGEQPKRNLLRRNTDVVRNEKQEFQRVGRDDHFPAGRIRPWGASGQNAEEYVAIINRFVAIVFINHDFDIQRIADAPEADQEELRVLFYDEIGERCAADSQKLLAGVVENSLVHAFDVMKGRGG
jgi:hypothetical protein